MIKPRLPFKPCAVYDTSIILQATLNPDGPAERALYVSEMGEVEAVMSNRLRSEYEAILTRPAIRAKNPELRQALVVEGQLERMDALAVRVDNAPERIAFPRDPNDAHLVNLVIHIQADFLVTRDKDLLSLDTDPAFRHLCPAIQILDPVAFLQEIEKRQVGAAGTNPPEKEVQ